MVETDMERCPEENCDNMFNPWASRDKGQKYPYKRCVSCNVRIKKEREDNYNNSYGGDKVAPKNDEVMDALRKLWAKVDNLERILTAKPFVDPNDEVTMDDIPA